ncbi:hypothetical protein Q5752_006703 [Cryptotrichosporon argae]
MSKTTSVFNALGSYADRIRDAASSTSPPAANGTLKSPTPVTAARLPASATSTVTSAAASSSSSPAPGATSATTNEGANDDDEGAWETVQSVKSRSRPERHADARDSRANKSRNWREKDEKTIEVSREREAQAQAVEHASSAAATTAKSAMATPPAEKARSASASAVVPPAARSNVTPAAPPKSVWGTISPAPAASLAQPIPAATVLPKVHSRTAPPSPSLGATATSSVPPSLASPNLSADTESTAATSLALKTADSTDDEGSWRAHPVNEKIAPPPQPPRQPAPAPTTNAWDLRKKQVASAASPATHSAPPTQPASTEATPNGDSAAQGEVKVTKKATPKKKAETTNGTPLADASLWPDIAQAAEAARQEEKKVKKEESASGSVADEPTGATSGRKPKWTPIPAAELQEAADKAAESSRKAKSAKRGGRPVETDSTRGRKQPARGGRPARAGSADEIRFPPQPEGSRVTQSLKFGSLEPNEPASATPDPVFVGTTASAPLSRQTSRQSTGTAARRSPGHPLSNLPSSEKRLAEFEPRAFTGCIPHHAFTPGGSGRPPRGRERDARGGFARGRGGFRGGAPMRSYPGMADEAAIYARGFGTAYAAPPAGFYPPAGGFVAPVYDPQAATAMGLPFARPGIAPPPMPVTIVPNLDPLRFYVLGQVEYYFGMNNLVMDFFLRQQMDSEGWIDIAMIASFNRIKSLTPEVAIIREVMGFSSLLEIREDKVRLAGADGKKWVLPDAKPSKFEDETANGTKLVGGSAIGDNKDIGQGLPNGILGASEDRPFDIADVQSALLKNGGDRAAAARNEETKGKSGNNDAVTAEGEGTESGKA